MRREACAVTLENLRNAVGAWAPGNRIFVVENEMVFSFLTEQLRGRGAEVGLLCTSGQLRTAAVKLLELFARAGYRIWYSGDMDPEGIEIADRLWKRFDGRGGNGGVEIWRMSSEDYRSGISGEGLKEARLARLDKVKHSVLEKNGGLCAKAEAGRIPGKYFGRSGGRFTEGKLNLEIGEMDSFILVLEKRR